MEFIERNVYGQDIGIYKITNIANGKIYIGQTQENFLRRYWHHQWCLKSNTHHNRKLQNAFNKYGDENFEFSIITVCNKEELNDLEIQYIKENDSVNKGYNISSGGQESNPSQYIPEEVRKRIGELNRQRLLGSKLSEETKQRMRESSRHLSPSDANKKAISEYMKNRVVSDETKSKLRRANLGEKSPVAKFTNDDIRNIKQALRNSITCRDLARQYDCSYGAIQAIKAGRSWSHIQI